jgi:formate C-acetyltransferase
MNRRIKNLRKALFEVKPSICAERARYFTETMKKTEGEYIAIRRAKAFANVLEKMSININKDEIIVGNQASKPKAAPIFPEYSVDWLEREFNGNPYLFNERPGDKFYYEEETKKEILEILKYWKGESMYENFRKSLPDECNHAWDMGIIDDVWVSAAGFGNVIVDYDMVLNYGLKEVIRRAKDKMKMLDLTVADNVKKHWFLESVIIADEAVIKFANRFARKCKEMASSEDNKERRDGLLAMYNNLLNVPENPVRTFWEAVQSVWIILLAQYIETNGHSVSLGRFDQYLYKFYRNDIEKGILDKDKALEIVEAFFLKANELNKLRSWEDTEFFLGYQMFINLSVAGQTEDGRDAVNDVSYLCVDASRELKVFTPSVSVKRSDYNSKEFIDYTLKAVQEHKGGQPAFYNDKAFIRILENMGVDKKDAWNWANVGCIESSIPGKWDFASKGPWFNIAKILELTLNNGKDPFTGITLLKGDGDLTTFNSMDEIMDAYKKQLAYFMKLQAITENINDEFHKMFDINAFRSSIVNDCIERGLSLIEGGSVYSAEGGPIVGPNTAGDSLAAIEYVIFEKKLLTGEQLAHALETNFEDMDTTPAGEEIRQLLLNKPPKFGNDNDKADKWPYEIENFVGSYYHKKLKNSRYGKGPLPGCYSLDISPVTGNIPFGMKVGATANGRKSKAPLNNGISPCNGMEKLGPTAAAKSVGKMPSIWFQKGAIFNMRLDKKTLLSDDGRMRTAAIIKTLFDNYGTHIQFNVVNNDVLKDAQKHPEKYSDLMVRISGYSALFTPLSREMQNDLIERAKFDV